MENHKKQCSKRFMKKSFNEFNKMKRHSTGLDSDNAIINIKTNKNIIKIYYAHIVKNI